MRNYLLVILFLTSSLIGFSQETTDSSDEFNHHCFYKKNSITIGLAPSYSIQLENSIGLNSRLYYNIGERICFGPEFSYFKKDEEKIYDLSLVAHYIFETKLAGLYPLIGANYTIEERSHHIEKEFGVVFGAGIHRNFNRITIFAEYAQVQSKLKGDFITMGLMLNIK